MRAGAWWSRRDTRREVRRVLRALPFLLPWIGHILALNLYPFLASLYFSFTVYSVLQPPRWVGLENYRDLFFADPRFWVSLYNTLYYTVFAVSTGTVTAILLALLLNMKVRGLSIYRTIYYIPSIVPLVATAIIWLWLFNPQYGIINIALNLVGLPTVGWFSDPAWSKPALVIMHLWGIGGAVVIYLAGLQDIPAELYEAAALDGAGSVQRFWHITLPLLTPTIFFNVVTGLIGAFQYFTQAYVTTAGGPADSTLMYSLYLYFSAFQFFKMGYASAMAWILFLLVLGCTWLLFRTSRRWVYYAGETA